MQRSKIAGIGYYVPKNVFTNEDLKKYMDTSDEWIQERTGIKERRYADRTGETTTTMGVEAAAIAIERAGITPQDIDFIIFATLSPDYYSRLRRFITACHENEGDRRFGCSQPVQWFCVCFICCRSVY